MDGLNRLLGVIDVNLREFGWPLAPVLTLVVLWSSANSSPAVPGEPALRRTQVRAIWPTPNGRSHDDQTSRPSPFRDPSHSHGPDEG